MAAKSTRRRKVLYRYPLTTDGTDEFFLIRVNPCDSWLLNLLWEQFVPLLAIELGISRGSSMLAW
jgi:hypothetical protein